MVKALARKTAMFTVCIYGAAPSPHKQERFIDYQDALERAVEDAKTTVCPHDIYHGLHLVAAVSAPSFAGKVTVDLTSYGRTLA